MAVHRNRQRGGLMRAGIAFVVALSLAACATVKETFSADGRKAYTLNCSGAARGWDKCFSAAGDLCKESGYDVLDRTGEAGAFAAVSGGAGGAGLTHERSMVVACKR